MTQPPSFGKIVARQVWFAPLLILTLIAGGFCFAGAQMLYQEQNFKANGAQVTGRITAKYTSVSSGKSKRTIYNLRYHFTTTDGYEMDGQDTAPRNTWDSVIVGAPVQVEYLRATPEKNRIAGHTQMGLGIGFASAGGAGFLLAGFFFLRSLKRVRLTKRLWEDGRRVSGTVAEVKETNVSVKRVNQWRIAYTYTDYAGRQHTGLSDYLPPEEAAEWKPGDACAVLCDKDQPEISVWAGKEAQ